MKFIMEEKIIRPTTKPEAIKGKLLKYQGTDYCEFMPQAQGEPQYEGISKTRHSQLKRSKGKAPKLVAHLTAQAESIDTCWTSWAVCFQTTRRVCRSPAGAACWQAASSD